MKEEITKERITIERGKMGGWYVSELFDDGINGLVFQSDGLSGAERFVKENYHFIVEEEQYTEENPCLIEHLN